MSAKPTYLRAAIEDWKAERISLERLCEIWCVSFFQVTFFLKVLRIWEEFPEGSVEQIEAFLEATKD